MSACVFSFVCVGGICIVGSLGVVCSVSRGLVGSYDNVSSSSFCAGFESIGCMKMNGCEFGSNCVPCGLGSCVYGLGSRSSWAGITSIDGGSSNV